MRSVLPLVLGILCSSVAHADATSTCESITDRATERQCLAWVQKNRGQCSQAPVRDDCEKMLRFILVKASSDYACVDGGYAVSEPSQVLCRAVHRRKDTTCNELRDSTQKADCKKTVAALEAMDAAGDLTDHETSEAVGATTASPGKTLMTMEQFRQETNLKFSYFRPRNNVTAVEAALQTYNDRFEDANDPIEKVVGLTEVWVAAQAYADLDSSKRNVSGLITSCEQEIDEQLRALAGTSGAFETTRNLARQMDMARQNLRNAGPTLQVWAKVDQAVKAMQRRLSPDDAAALQSKDVEALDAMRGGAPATTAAVLDKALAVLQSDDVRVMDSRAGSDAGYNSEGDGFVLRYGQHNTDDIRLGTMVHEATHVASASKYGNTPVMFTYAVDTDRSGVLAIERERIGVIRSLIRRANASDLSAYQKHWIVEDKLEYALQVDPGKVLQALGRVPNKGTDDAPDAVYASARLHLDLALERGGLTQVLWEYETVLNQILVYLAHWGVPENHPFHAAVLTEVAKTGLAQ